MSLVSPRLAALVAGDADRLAQFSDTAAYFFRDGKPLLEGSRLINAEYADVMRRMANEGAQVIYSGNIAQAIVDTVRGADSNPGVISLADLQTYKVNLPHLILEKKETNWLKLSRTRFYIMLLLSQEN